MNTKPCIFKEVNTMRTNKTITFAALNSHYLDTSDMRINEEYFNDALIIWGENTERFYKAYTQSKRTIRSIVWEIFTDLANHHIKTNEYPYNQDCYASSEQLKAWLKEYGDGYETLLPAIVAFQDLRQEYKEG
jgi:hypothetical protein